MSAGQELQKLLQTGWPPGESQNQLELEKRAADALRERYLSTLPAAPEEGNP